MLKPCMCTYGNCDETDTPWSLSISNSSSGTRERYRFCGKPHMNLWMAEHAAKSFVATLDRISPTGGDR